MKKVLLSIGGSDSGGGAGIQADLRTFKGSFDHYGCSVVTALTSQNPLHVTLAEGASVHSVKTQLQAVLDCFDIGGVKTGMLWSKEIIQVVIEALSTRSLPLVIDPVMISTSGHALLQQEAMDLLKNELLPLATFITPNIPEATALTGIEIEDQCSVIDALRAFRNLTQATIIIKGGHASGAFAKDYVLHENQIYSFGLPRLQVDPVCTHGTGCTFSAALLAATQNVSDVCEQIAYAKTYVYEAIRARVKISPTIEQMGTPTSFYVACKIEKIEG